GYNFGNLMSSLKKTCFCSSPHGACNDITAFRWEISTISNSTFLNFSPTCRISSASVSGSHDDILTFFNHEIGSALWRTLARPCIPDRCVWRPPCTQPRNCETGILLIPTLVLLRGRKCDA